MVQLDQMVVLLGQMVVLLDQVVLLLLLPHMVVLLLPPMVLQLARVLLQLARVLLQLAQVLLQLAQVLLLAQMVPLLLTEIEPNPLHPQVQSDHRTPIGLGIYSPASIPVRASRPGWQHAASRICIRHLSIMIGRPTLRKVCTAQHMRGLLLPWLGHFARFAHARAAVSVGYVDIASPVGYVSVGYVLNTQRKIRLAHRVGCF